MTVVASPRESSNSIPLRAQQLFDAYGRLLTERQREACSLHLEEDWSFAEVAEAFACSRSAAHDLVHRGVQLLESYEERLGFVAELNDRDRIIATLRQRLEIVKPLADSSTANRDADV